MEYKEHILLLFTIFINIPVNMVGKHWFVFFSVLLQFLPSVTGVPWMPVDVKYVYDVVCLFLPVCVCVG